MTPQADGQLRRSISLPALVAYGVGTMVGGGFYALLGKVVGEAGMAAPSAILFAGVLALLSAISFGQMARRYPSSAGEARYVEAAFGKRWLASCVGWGVVASGIVSAATLADAFAGFVITLEPSIPRWTMEAGLLLALVGVAVWGVRQSTALAVTITVIELGGLVWVLVVQRDALAEAPTRLAEFAPSFTGVELGAVMAGAFLAFYAYIGFEDMVNMAEEVREPERNLPRGILAAMLVTVVLYLLVAVTAVVAVPVGDLAESGSPLALLAGSAPGAALVMTLIGMLAGVNGALVQLVMASRVIYGMGKRGGAPSALGAVSPVTQTPIRATVIAGGVALALAWWLPVGSLARVTSAIILCVFTLVHVSLIVTQRRESRRGWVVRSIVPILGAVACSAMVVLAAMRLF